jgi:YfiH family protein
MTTRQGGVSTGCYGLHGNVAGGLNLADHVGDDPIAVAHNRALLPAPSPLWLRQVHGTTVIHVNQAEGVPDADAAIASAPGRACVVLTADCLPVLFADRDGRCVGAAHAGWRGLVQGVLENTVTAMKTLVPDAELCAFLGPAIGPDSYEVGDDVVQAFLCQDAATMAAIRTTSRPGKYLLDLYALAKQRLIRVGVNYIGGGERDTLKEPKVFYSFRRDGVCGRMASLIWLD